MGSIAIIGSASTLTIKISILLFYFRLFRTSPGFRHWAYLGMLSCVLSTVAYWGVATASIVECNTPQSIDIPFCAKSDIPTIVMAIVSIFTDFYVLALPVKVVMQLSVKRGKKFGLIAVFLCGLL